MAAPGLVLHFPEGIFQVKGVSQPRANTESVCKTKWSQETELLTFYTTGKKGFAVLS